MSDKRAFEALLDELLGASFDQDWPAEQKARAAVLAAYTDLEERERMRLAGISTAALGYWKEGDSIHPDYDTVALRDVAKLYVKYDELYQARDAAAGREGQYLAEGMRFKLAATRSGAAAEFRSFPAELAGKWVALVDATDGKHLCTHPAPKADESADCEERNARREHNEERFMEFCNHCWDVPSEDHPILSLSTADLRRIYKLAEWLAASPARGGEGE